MATISMAVNSGARLWTPYRALYDVVVAAVFKHQPGSVHDLEMALRKHKPDFISLLKTPTKNAVHRDIVKKSATEGIPLRGEQRSQTFSQQFIAEALILSDLFSMDELAAVELLMAGEQQLPNYPGLTRGLVAVLLYYDGRRSIANALRTLLQAREGRLWTVGVTSDVASLVNSFTDQLVEEGLVINILDLIRSMDLTLEMDKLQTNRALGPPKHKKQVVDLFEEIKLSLAECIFCLACQQPLNKSDTIRLIGHVREDNSVAADNTLEPVLMCLLLALLYCFDVGILDQEDAEGTIEKLPVISDNSYVAEIHRMLISTHQHWVIPGIKATAQFAWGIMLRQLSQYPLASGINDLCEEDESLLDIAIENDVFAFLKDAIVARHDFHQDEFFTKRIHGLITDFIYHMPLKVKELRNRGDEIARIIIAHEAEGLEVPAHRRDLENMFQLICDVYSKDPLGLELSLEYWCPPDTSGLHESLYSYRPPPRQVALYKFVRLAGDLLPPPLYVPYISMITGLARGPQSAQHCFHLLKMNGVNAGGSAGSVSWDHIFDSLNKYFLTLRRETSSAMETSHMYRAPPIKGIKIPEQDAIAAVLQLMTCVAEQNENCREAFCENQQWGVVGVVFGLVSCNIPTLLKAELFLALSALAKTPTIAANIWHTLEATQILPTAATPDQKGGIQVELDEIESRNEEYPMTRAFLQLLDTLTDIPIPAGLGAGFRAPGFDPYLDYIIQSVFLKFNSRAYRKSSEKWHVAALCLNILCKLLREHEISEDDFREQLVEVQGGGIIPSSKPPGHTLMLHMLNDSTLLKMILQLLDDAVKQYEQYTNLQGREWLDRASEYCLKMLEGTLEKEDEFERMIRDTGSPIMIVAMERLLLSINPRSQKADHLVNVAKFIVFNTFLPQHALSAVRILYSVCQSAPIQSELVGLFTADETISSDLLHGFVECLENDEPELRVEEKVSQKPVEFVSTSEVRNLARQHVIQLMLHAMNQPAPNIAHWMLGFEVRKPVHRTNLQDPGILGSPKTCLHSILALLDNGIGTRRGPVCLIESPRLAEFSYQLVYVLAANKDTSAPFLRYIRTTHDFLFKQLHHLPFRSQETEVSLSNHQAWLLKTIAIELRITALNRQRSHTQRLLKLLLSDTDDEQTTVLQPVGGEEPDGTFWDRDTSIYQTGTSVYSRQVSTAQQTRRKLLCLLDSIEFTEPYPQPLGLKVFDTKLIEQVIRSCECHTQSNIVFCDVPQLRRILINELNNQQGTMMAGQRPIIMEEIQLILSTVVVRNAFRESLYMKRQAFEAWRQVTEILLTACPEDLLTGETRQMVIFELLQDLLVKVSDEDALPELTAPVAGVILILMGNLRQCFLTDTVLRAGVEHKSSYLPSLDQSGTPAAVVETTGSRTLFATSLQTVLKGLLEYILKSGGRAQRSRANLYGALLYYLQIAQKPATLTSKDADEASVERVLGARDLEYEQLSKENLATVHSYGDGFMEVVCRDACDGHDIGRMLALSLLDTVVAIDYFQQWMAFLSTKGYLQHLVDSLLHDDPNLQKILEPNPAQLKTLYIYQSKMSLLTRIGETAEGAHLLLRCSIMQKLAACGFFDLRPEMDNPAGDGSGEMLEDDFIPSPLTRYRILLFCALKLCLAILTSHGIENKDVAAQVMLFLMSHGEVINAILHSRKPSMNLQTLKELELMTAVIARASFHNELGSEYLDSDTAMVEFQGQRARIQRQMLSLLTHYSFSDKFSKQLQKLEEKRASEDTKAQIALAYEEIASNIAAFCRSLLTESGPCSQYSRILFGPCLEEGNVRDIHASEELQFSNFGANQSPNLGIVVYQLKQCCSRFLSVFDSHRQHAQKLAGIYDLSTEDLKELAGIGATEKMSSQQRQELARKRLQKIVSYKTKELQHYAYIIENCLFILWRHLEYYLVHCIPVDQQPHMYQSHRKQLHQIRRLQEVTGVNSVAGLEPECVTRPQFEELSRGITRDQTDQLRLTAPAIINESLFKKIHDISQCYSKKRSHYCFTEAVVRRIKRLLRLHTGS